MHIYLARARFVVVVCGAVGWWVGCTFIGMNTKQEGKLPLSQFLVGLFLEINKINTTNQPPSHFCCEVSTQVNYTSE